MTDQLYETPYGRKTGDLLTKAMDAYEREPAAVALAQAVLNVSGRRTANKAKELATAFLDAKSKGKLP